MLGSRTLGFTGYFAIEHKLISAACCANYVWKYCFIRTSLVFLHSNILFLHQVTYQFMVNNLILALYQPTRLMRQKQAQDRRAAVTATFKHSCVLTC